MYLSAKHLFRYEISLNTLTLLNNLNFNVFIFVTSDLYFYSIYEFIMQFTIF